MKVETANFYATVLGPYFNIMDPNSKLARPIDNDEN